MKVVTQKTQSIIRRFTLMGGRFFVLLAAAAIVTTAYISTVQAQTANSTHSADAQEYCARITPTSNKNACMDGWDDPTKCADYGPLDPAIAQTCTAVSEDKITCGKAKEAKKDVAKTSLKLKDSPGCPQGEGTAPTDDGTCKTTTTTTTPQSTTTTTTTSKPDSKGECNAEQLQSDLDKFCEGVEKNDKASEEAKNTCKNRKDDASNGDSDGDGKTSEEEIEELKEAVEKLEKEAEKALPDNQYGKYVNGANEYQAIRVNRAPGDNKPAMVLFHGGGWTSDDGAADKFAAKANERGYTTFVATYRLGTSGVYYQLDDTLRAMKHVKDNAGMYGIDPNKIAIWGDSAGGSLAMRAAGTGKSGAKVAVGWSAPTNAYTGLFHSLRSFAVGMSHSTCAPTDLEGVNNVLDEINGEESDSKSTTGSSSSSTSDLATNVLTIAAQAQQASETTEEISQKLEDEEGQSELSGNVRRLAAKKLLECIDNFNSASPALFASPQTPPSFLAGYDTDPLVHPGQAYQMRDKLRSLGIPSEAFILPGLQPTDTDRVVGNETNGENHLGYHEKFVPATLDFVDKFLNPQETAAASNTDQPAAQASTPQAATPAPSPSPSSNSGSNSNNNSNSGNNSNNQTDDKPKSVQATCTAYGQGYDDKTNTCIPSTVTKVVQAKNCKGTIVGDFKDSTGHNVGTGSDRLVKCSGKEGTI